MKLKKAFSHLDARGNARMVNVGGKPVQRRRAVAAGQLTCAPATIRALKKNALPKGDVLTVAQIAGIQANGVHGVFSVTNNLVVEEQEKKDEKKK